MMQLGGGGAGSQNKPTEGNQWEGVKGPFTVDMRWRGKKLRGGARTFSMHEMM